MMHKIEACTITYEVADYGVMTETIFDVISVTQEGSFFKINHENGVDYYNVSDVLKVEILRRVIR